MNSESLNIKLYLDIGDITAGVQKVKSRLSSMANTVKQSIPQINNESKKAKDSLSKVSDAGNQVKKSMAGIGDEAKKSLSGVVSQSNKVTQALNAMGIASRNNQTGFNADTLTDSTDEASLSLEELQGTMNDILTLNVFGVLGNALSHSGLKENIATLKTDFADFSSVLKTTTKAQVDFEKRVKSIKKNIPSSEMATFKKRTDEVRKSFKQLQVLNLKTLGASLKPVLRDIGIMTAKVLGLAAALGTVLATVNAIKVSKLGKELYTNAQQAGFSAQGYQEWAYVLEKAGVEAQELREIMKTLTESQVDVIDGNEDMIKAYASLGMSIEEVKSMNQEELWSSTIKALQNVENTTERTAIAYKLFSEDTAKLTTVLNLSNEQTQQLIASYNQLGGAMSKELIHNSNVLQGSLLNLRIACEGLKNTLAQYVIPVVIVVVEWLTKAIVAVSTFLKLLFNLDTTPMTDNMSAGMDKTTASLGGVAGSANDATKAVEKLKKSTMGFDELNIVTDPNASASSGSGSGNGAGSALGNLGSVNTSNSIFTEASKQAEELKKKLAGFKEEIAIVGSALGTLGVAKLLEGLGKAIGLGDKFLGTMATIKNLAKSAITIVLQYTLVNEFMDKYLEGEGFKNYIMGLITSAIGSGILYKMWGPTGLVIGLGVTAVASIKAVIDNGGIDSVESATVAFTGLASAIAAVSIAVKKLGLGKLMGELGAFIALVKEGNSVWAVFGAAFPKLAGTFAKIGTAISGAAKAVGAFVAGLGGGTIAAIIAIVAALASVVYFLYENWEKVTKAAQDFFKNNIAPKLEEIKDSWEKMKNAVKEAGQAIADAIPESVKQKLKEIGDAISDVVTKIGEWFASMEWLDAIGVVFETLGGIIFGVLSGVVAGAIQGVITIIGGLVKAFSGIVQVVSGVVEAIVKLFKGDFKGAWEACKKIVDGIVDLFVGMYDATIGWVADMVEGIIDWCIELWDELVGHSIIPDMVEAIIEWFETLYDDTIGVIVNWAKGIISKIKTMWSDIKGWFNSNVAPKFTKQYWTNKFDTIRQAA